MKNALILHGTNSNPTGNWFPWLKSELEKQNYNVFCPDLPQCDKPNTNRYLDFIKDQGWEFNEESVLIGHSSGAVAILGILQKLEPSIIVDTCILAGAFKDSLGREDLDELFLQPLDFEKIKMHAKRIIFIHSDNDPYCPLPGVKYLAEKLDAKIIVIPGQGHFNLEMGEKYREFPELLKIISRSANAS